MSDSVIAINGLLAAYASTFNDRVSIVPNCVDTERYQPRADMNSGVVRLVWVGSQSNIRNLRDIARPLRRLQSEHHAPLHIIGAGDVDLPGVDATVLPWSASTEVRDLQACHVGLVPLLDDLPWNRWKSPFKILQYMAVGLPVIARRIGSASEVIEDGVNGFLVDTEDEWYDRLLTLVGDAALRRSMGRNARATVVTRYSPQVHMPRMVTVFDTALQRARSGAVTPR